MTGPPILVVELEFSSVAADFAWNSAAGSSTGTVGYEVLRATDPTRFDEADMLACGLETTTFVDTDAPEGVFYYLVRAANDCGSTLGRDSSGATRSANTCP